ncbi:MAG: flavodoxin family protein [Dermatophilaceae bacterium]
MAVLIVIETSFGNTRRIAEAIRLGLQAKGTEAPLIEAAAAPTDVPADVHTVVVGAPTHNSGLPSPASRAQAAAKGGAEATPGVREWIERVTPRAHLRAVTFDTSQRSLFNVFGVARKSAAKALQRRGFDDVVTGESFWVEGVSGPLASGEEGRAERWGQSL